MGDRARVEARLDDLVADHRFEIAVVFPVVGAVTLLASAWGLLPGFLSFNPYFILFGTLVMRLPLVAGLAPLVDRRAAVALVALLAGPRARSRLLRLLAVAATVVWMDVVLDPAAVALGFWEYYPPGVYYGVPLSNYAGWVLSAVVSVALLDWGFDPDALRDRLADCEYLLDDLVSFVILWGAVNLAFGQAVPAVAAGALGVALLRTDRFDFAVLRGRTPS